jgi:hypothetical protein
MELFGNNSEGGLRALYDEDPTLFPNVTDPTSLDNYMKTLTQHRTDADESLIKIALEQDREIIRLRKEVEDLSHQLAVAVHRLSRSSQGPNGDILCTNTASGEASTHPETDMLPLLQPDRLVNHPILQEAICLMARTDPDAANAYDQVPITFVAAEGGAPQSPRMHFFHFTYFLQYHPPLPHYPPHQSPPFTTFYSCLAFYLDFLPFFHPSFHPSFLPSSQGTTASTSPSTSKCCAVGSSGTFLPSSFPSLLDKISSCFEIDTSNKIGWRGVKSLASFLHNLSFLPS